jgi:hypothetical protein
MRRRDETGRRVVIPLWLSNPEFMAPCICGRMIDPDIPIIVAEERTTGLSRWFHYECWEDFVEDDDEHEEYE